MSSSSPSNTPNLPHCTACPKCGKFTIVAEGHQLYVCLACGEKKSTAKKKPKDPPVFGVILAIVGLVIFLNFLHETENRRPPFQPHTQTQTP